MVKIPLNENIYQLGESKDHAIQRFYSLEIKLNKHNEWKSQCVEFMRQYKKLNHMSQTHTRFRGTTMLFDHTVRKESHCF